MKKIILSVALLTSIAFISCSDDNDTNSCKTCVDLENTKIDIKVCDNGNGTATVTTSFEGKEVSTTQVDIPEGESVDRINCSDLTGGDVVIDDGGRGN